MLEIFLLIILQPFLYTILSSYLMLFYRTVWPTSLLLFLRAFLLPTNFLCSSLLLFITYLRTFLASSSFAHSLA